MTPPKLTPQRRRLVHWGLRIGVTAALLTLIFHIVPIHQVVEAARRLPPALWVAGLVFFLAGHALSAAKWRVLIGGHVPFSHVFRAHLAGLGANLALPGVAGGDVVRAALVMPVVRDKGRLAIGSVADRVVDTLSLGLVAVVGAWAAWRAQVAWADEGMAAFAVLLVVGTFAAFHIARVAGPAAVRRFAGGKIGAILERIVSILADIGREPWRLGLCLMLSIIVQCLFVGINIAFADALGLNVPAAAWFYAWASAKIIAIAPISLGGLGVREASMAALLKPFHAEYGAVIAVGLIWQTVLYASGIIGVILQSTLSGPGASAAPSGPRDAPAT